MSIGERYLCFSVGDEEFAVKLLHVREVIAMPEVTPVPQVPSYFLGIMNLRGQVISVIDLRTKLGFKPEMEAETAAIIFDVQNIKIGVIVNSVNSVLAPNEDEISDRPEIAGGSGQHDFISGVYKKEDQLILLMDIAKALSLEDVKLAKKAVR